MYAGIMIRYFFRTKFFVLVFLSLSLYQMSVDPEAAVSVDVWEPDGLAGLGAAEDEDEDEVGGLKAVGSQDRMFSRARLMIAHQPILSSRVSALSRWRMVV